MQRKPNVEFAASLRHSNGIALESGDEEQEAMLGYPGVDLGNFKGVEREDAEERESSPDVARTYRHNLQILVFNIRAPAARSAALCVAPKLGLVPFLQ
ncbi:hypothetical protein DFH09DRAFT_1377456 [Mycena vulgaris]|nr:hypothetical protein DFH09DRAFT_1377456 [Mycena vulgaris]